MHPRNGSTWRASTRRRILLHLSTRRTLCCRPSNQDLPSATREQFCRNRAVCGRDDLHRYGSPRTEPGEWPRRSGPSAGSGMGFDADGWLHARMAMLRGVENGFSIARAPRHGILTVSDTRGHVLAERSTAVAPFSTILTKVPCAARVFTPFEGGELVCLG